MGEFEDKVSQLLSSPDGMEQIMAVARMLSQNGGIPAAPQSAAPPSAASPPPPESEPAAFGTPAAESGAGPDLSKILSSLSGLGGGGGGLLGSLGSLGNLGNLGNIGSLLSNLDPALISSALSLLGETASPNNRSAALLMALKPYLKEERQSKVERALQLAKLLRVGKNFFTGLARGGRNDV